MSDYINFNDMVVTSFFWNSVFGELTNHNNLYQENFYTKGYRVLYLVRLWSRRTGNYFYKVGSSEDFAKRVRQLNNTYDCCGRIIVVAAAIIYSLEDEQQMHEKLESYLLEESVQVFHKDRELYELNYNVYEIFTTKINNFAESIRFVSEDYMFEDGTERMYVEDDDTDLDLTYGMVELDCDDMEQEYWLYRRSI
jgi:hypothetical protein